jgi:hypothetical protein
VSGDLNDRHRALTLARAAPFVLPSVITSWLRGSATSGDQSSVADVLNPSNPAIQGQSARRPTALSDSSLQYNTNDVMVWPLIPQNNGELFWLWAGWIEHDAVTVVAEMYCSIFNLTNGASARKVEFGRHSNGALRFDCYTSDGNARRFTTTATFGADPFFALAEFCATQTGEANQMVVRANGAVQSGTFADVGTPAPLSGGLTAGVTGNMMIGNRRDGVAASPLNGRMARNQWCGASGPMAGVTQGLLTAEAVTALQILDAFA